MPLPRKTREALAATDYSPLGVVLADAPSCEGAKFHSPTPLVLHRVTLRDGETVLLCGTCKGNLEVLQHLLEATGGDLEWQVRREFGNRLRALGTRGWTTNSEDVAG